MEFLLNGLEKTAAGVNFHQTMKGDLKSEFLRAKCGAFFL
jgi:hypothetical protein